MSLEKIAARTGPYLTGLNVYVGMCIYVLCMYVCTYLFVCVFTYANIYVDLYIMFVGIYLLTHICV